MSLEIYIDKACRLCSVCGKNRLRLRYTGGYPGKSLQPYWEDAPCVHLYYSEKPVKDILQVVRERYK